MRTQKLQLLVVLVGAFVIAVLALNLLLAFDVAQAQGGCDLSTVQGSYVFEAQGVSIDENGEVVAYAEAGVWTLDGEGNANGVISASTNGTPFARRDAFTASYELTTGCVYAVVDQFGLEVDLYASPDGSQIMYFSPGFSGTMIRI